MQPNARLTTAHKWAWLQGVPVIGLINDRDQYHKRATDMSKRYENSPVLITDAVLLEIGNALARSHRSEAGDTIEYFLTSAVERISRCGARRSALLVRSDWDVRSNDPTL